MDFRKLSYFEAVCRVMSFTKAAELLHVTQPSVTMAVRDLENELGVQLINRYRGKLFLTPEGEYVLTKARFLVETLEKTEQEVHSFLIKKRHNLRVGYAMQTKACLCPLLTRFQLEHENVHITEQESPTMAIVSQVLNGGLDLGVISISSSLERDITSVPLFEGELRVCMSKNNPLASRPSITLDEFLQQPLVALTLNNPQDSYIFRHMQDAYPNQRIILKPQATYLMLDSYFQHIQTQNGVGLTYYDIWYSPQQAPGQESLISLPFSPPCYYRVSVIYSKDNPLSQGAKQLISFLKDSVNTSPPNAN